MIRRSSQARQKCGTPGKPLRRSLVISDPITSVEQSVEITSRGDVDEAAARFAKSLEYYRQQYAGQVIVTLSASFRPLPRLATHSSRKKTSKGS